MESSSSIKNQSLNQDSIAVDVPAGGYFIYNPNLHQNYKIFSTGAFGCCYLHVKFGENVLFAHINATSVMVDSVAKLSVSKMFQALKECNHDLDLSKAEITIVHSNDPKEYEKGFKNRPSDLTKDQIRPRGHYSEKFDENDFSIFVAEPFANKPLQKAIENYYDENHIELRQIKVISDFNSNLAEFMQNPDIKAVKTDAILDKTGKMHLKQDDGSKASSSLTLELFDKIKSSKPISPSWNETPSVGRHYAFVANDIKDGKIKVLNGTAEFLTEDKNEIEKYNQFAVMDMNRYVQDKLKPQFIGPQGAAKMAIDGTLSKNPVIMVNPNEVYQDKVLIATSDANEIGNQNDIAHMASIGKILTAKTVIEYFKGDLEIKIATILEDYPEGTSKFIDELKQLPHYNEITLAHLLNHTAGLAQFSQKGFDDLTSKNSECLLIKDILSHELDKSSVPEFGKHHYSNAGYELVGLILEHDSRLLLEELQRNLVLEPVGLKNEIFLRDDLQKGIDGKFCIKNHPEKNLLLGMHFNGSKLNPLPNLSHCAGAGIYANPKSVAKLAKNIWTQENIESLQQYETEIPNSDGAKYGIGYIRSNEMLNHDGGMDGTRSSVMLNLKTKKAACVVATLENYTPKIAKSIDGIEAEEHYEEIQKLKINMKRYACNLSDEAKQEFGLLKNIQRSEFQAWSDKCVENLHKICNYVKEFGWNFHNKKDEFAAFLMVQHGDSNRFLNSKMTLENATKMQEFILNEIKQSQSFTRDKSTSLIYAFVEDRVNRNRNVIQNYGTQVTQGGLNHINKDVETNRQSIGFKEPLSEYKNRISSGDPVTYQEILDSNQEMQECFNEMNKLFIVPKTKDILPEEKEKVASGLEISNLDNRQNNTSSLLMQQDSKGSLQSSKIEINSSKGHGIGGIE